MGGGGALTGLGKPDVSPGGRERPLEGLRGRVWAAVYRTCCSQRGEPGLLHTPRDRCSFCPPGPRVTTRSNKNTPVQ